MTKQYIPQNMPLHEVKEVVFDGRLAEMSFNLLDREQLDATDYFWNGIYLACLPESMRQYITDEKIQILDLVVMPSDYDIEKETVNVLLCSNWKLPSDTRVHLGYSIYVSFSTDGTFTYERLEQPLRYSKSMKWHIRELYANTAVEYDNLSPDNAAL